ncbi:MAG: hypothetical protein ACRD24_13305 [Terriglobales bacterium]
MAWRLDRWELTSANGSGHAQAMAHRPAPAIPVDLRTRLETARLDLLALFRALNRMDLSAAEIPQGALRQLFGLDADFAEALWGLDQPAASLNLSAMVADTQAALDQLPEADARFRKHLPRRAHPTLANLETSIRKTLDPHEAYSMIPGRDPQNG